MYGEVSASETQKNMSLCWKVLIASVRFIRVFVLDLLYKVVELGTSITSLHPERSAFFLYSAVP
jgi:hypothetical protein